MLTEKQCPWTGPYGLAESGLPSKGPTNEALKRAMSRLGFRPWEPDKWDDNFNKPLADDLAQWDPGNSGYGPGRWTKIRSARVPAGKPHAGEYALDQTALDLIMEDWKAHHMPPPMPDLVYPHDKAWHSYSGGYVHTTGGISGNRALDFLAAPGTPVLAVEAGTVSRTSGYDPATGLHGKYKDVFGWSIYTRSRYGFWYSTHYGTILVGAGAKVEAGDIIGFVGHWPYDIGRSHTHYGYTSWTHLNRISDAKIRAVAAAPRVTGQAVGV
jgi:murein DD-endopeptidase MepM/ murein hydrolase activator NlpD